MYVVSLPQQFCIWYGNRGLLNLSIHWDFRPFLSIVYRRDWGITSYRQTWWSRLINYLHRRSILYQCHKCSPVNLYQKDTKFSSNDLYYLFICIGLNIEIPEKFWAFPFQLLGRRDFSSQTIMIIVESLSQQISLQMLINRRIYLILNRGTYIIVSRENPGHF